MSNKYSDQLMQALEVVVDEKISTLQFDKTIQATITEIENADTGEYKVNYKEGIISAFAQDPKELFKVGDRVYVTVPEGDFSNKKFISHKITNNSLSTGQYTDLAETIVEVSPDFQNLGINYSKDEIGLIAGSQLPDSIDLLGTIPVSWTKVVRSNESYQYYMDFTVQRQGNSYQWQYLKPGDSWKDSPAEGNKTATLQIPASTSRNNYQYKCIVDGVASSIVQLSSSGGVNYSAKLVDDLSIELSNNFKLYNEKYEYIQISAEFMTTLEEQSNKIINKGDYGVILNFSDSNNQIVSCILNLSNFVGDPYHLWTWLPQSAVVKLPKGATKLQNIKFYEQGFDDSQIMSSTEPNIFMRNLSLSFVEIVDLTNTPYYLTIVPQEGIIFGNNNSLHLTGRIIHYGTEINPSTCIYKWFERDLSVVAGSEEYDKRVGWGWRAVNNGESKTLEVLKTKVNSQQTFKLLVVYDSSIVMTREITLIANELKATIEQVTSGNEIRLKLTSIDNKSYVGEWYYLNNSGEQVLITEGLTNETDNIVPYLLYSPITFYCAVYSENDYLGELSYVMRNLESSDDVSIVFIGESMFAYDANGDINIYDAELERSLVPEITFNNNVISSSVVIDWLDFNGNVISESGEGYDSTDSMIKSVRVDKTTNTLYYKVKHKFKDVPSKKKNTFKIRITTLDGQTYIFDKEIVFIKTGDPGTNGTRYQSLITITSANKFVGVSNSNTSITLNCKVFKDQTEFTGASVSWQLYNLATVSQSGMSISIKANNNVQKRYVKATITIVDEGKTTTLYDFYPVNSCASQPSIDLSELPKYIQYASNGRNPQFRKQVPIIIYNGTTATIASGDTTVIKIANNQFKPIDEFNPDNPIGLLTVTVSGITIYHPVPMYINTFGNEAINGWDGVSVDVDAAGGKILAPQVGAGTKDSANKFTGVVMGRDSAQQKIGLYGYQAGVNSFGLTEEGKAYFGVVGKGRITIDGTSATISGGGGGRSESGMTITLSAAASTADAIRVGNGNFIVTYGGKLTAKSADVEGKITAGDGNIGGWSINSELIYQSGAVYLYSGNNYIDTFELQVSSPYYEYKNKSPSGSAINPSSEETKVLRTAINRFEYNQVQYIVFKIGNNEYCVEENEVSIQSRYRIWAGNKTPYTSPFTVTGKGVVRATNAIVSGTITATAGSIGGWTISSNRLQAFKTNKYVGLNTANNYALYAGAEADSSGTIKIGDAPFSVTFDGALKATNATIKGTITAGAGSIGGWRLGAARLASGSGNTYVALDSGTDKVDYAIWAGKGESSEAPFSVTRGGDLTATNATIEGKITAKTGYIGGTTGWIINSNKIYGSKTFDDNNVTKTKYVALSTQGQYAIYAGSDDTNDNGEKGNPAKSPFWVKFDGSFKAVSGQIGNWKINSGNDGALRSTLSDKEASTRIYINGKPSSGGNVIEIRTSGQLPTGDNEDKTDTNGRFYVTDQGKLFAQSAEIRGTIKSKAGSIGTWNITNNAISTLTSETTTANSTTGMAKNGFTGYVGSITGEQISNIAFWAGMSYKKSGNDYYLLGSSTGSFFAVTHSGKLYCRSAEVSGKIIVGSGSEIDGQYITDGTVGNNKITSISGNKITTGTIDTNRLDADTIKSEIVLTTNLNADKITSGTINTDRLNAATIKSQIVTADYINTLNIVAGSVAAENITGTTISGKTISGGSVHGSKYYNTYGSGYLTVGGDSTYPDFELIRSSDNFGDITVFGIYDGVDYIDIYGLGTRFLKYSSSAGGTILYGDWDFTHATVTGINTTATFG